MGGVSTRKKCPARGYKGWRRKIRATKGVGRGKKAREGGKEIVCYVTERRLKERAPNEKESGEGERRMG